MSIHSGGSSHTSITSNSGSRPSSSSTSHHHQSQPTPACAACKYQRRRCKPDCILAPYFPADAQRQFLNTHRLFGVRNILSIIKGLDPFRRAEAMQTIIFQSNARAYDRVGGCYRMVRELEQQIELHEAELALVRHHLAFYRAQAQQQQQNSMGTQMLSEMDLGIHPNLLLNATVLEDGGGEDDAIYGDHHAGLVVPMQQQPQQPYYNYFYYDGDPNNSDENDDDRMNVNNTSTAHSNGNGDSVNDSFKNGGMEMEAMLTLQQEKQEQEEEEHEQYMGVEEDVKPFVDMFEVRHALAMAEEDEQSKNPGGSPFSCSAKAAQMKEYPNSMEHVQEHDLKGAASLFTLTNCNTSNV